MITLYGFGPAFNLVDPSPFVLKVHFLLKLSGRPFQLKSGVDGLRKAPKGKLPFIEVEGEKIADSFFIQRYLEKECRFTIDEHLTPAQKATSALACSAIQEQLYWYVVYYRWADDSNWAIMKKTFFNNMPFILRKIIPGIARKGMLKTLSGQGTSRYTDAEIVTLAKCQFDALSELLGNNDFCFNNKLSMLDVVLYALLVEILFVPLPSPIKDLAEQYPNLVSFCKGIHQKYFDD